MISYDEAVEIIRANRWNHASLKVPLSSVIGQRLSMPITALFDSPAFSNSAMDGYALGSLEGPWQVVGVAAAGSSDQSVKPNEAFQIFTGALVPTGTMAVIAQEDCSIIGDRLHANVLVNPGRHIRHLGEEFVRGSTLCETGTRLTPPVLSALASQGLECVPVKTMPKVALISTGSELLKPGEPYQNGMIYESNSYGLAPILRSFGCDVTLATVPDDELITIEILNKLASTHDLLVTVGGVSVGDRDYVRAAIKACGFEMMFWKVAVKPGKPVGFATRQDGKAWIGLPGNPMSALVTCCLFVANFLGEELVFHPFPLSHDFERAPGREEFVPAVLNWDSRPNLVLHGTVGSHAIAGLGVATGLARIPKDEAHLNPGEVLQYADLPWRPK